MSSTEYWLKRLCVLTGRVGTNSVSDTTQQRLGTKKRCTKAGTMVCLVLMLCLTLHLPDEKKSPSEVVSVLSVFDNYANQDIERCLARSTCVAAAPHEFYPGDQVEATDPSDVSWKVRCIAGLVLLCRCTLTVHLVRQCLIII